jgi:trk system potassium uptake protein TrkH
LFFYQLISSVHMRNNQGPMSQQESLNVLTYAVRGRVVLKYAAQLTLIQAILVLVPALVSLPYGEYTTGLDFLFVSVALALLALPWVRLSVPADIQTNEAMSIAAISFLIGACAMVYPFMAGGIPFIDSLFEAVSGITTTGLSTLNSVEDKSRTFLFARSWIQWYGGLGIVVLSLALLMGHSAAFRRLVEPASSEANLATGMRTYARHAITIYVLLTLMVGTALWIIGLDFFTALVHALSSISTGGFSSFDNSLSGIDVPAARAIITFSGFIGAVSLPLFYRVYRRGLREITVDTETVGLLRTTFLVCFLLALLLFAKGGIAGLAGLADTFLLGVSAQTTTGFSNIDVSQLDPASKTVLIASMSIGGEVGSTAGGIKVLRLLVLLRILQLVIHRTALPRHAVLEPRLTDRRIDDSEIIAVLSLLIGFGAVVLISWIPFLMLGYDPLNALFDVVSATSTTGLSAGVTQTDLPGLLKGILCFDMLAGRLEVIALLVLLYPRTWFGTRVTSS